MTDYIFIGNYRANLKGGDITLGSKLRHDLEKNGISEVYFVKDKEIGRNMIKAYPRLPLGEDGIRVKVEKGKFRIPAEAKNEFIEYAGLKPGEVAIIGMEIPSSHLQIWNALKVDRITDPPLSDRNMKQVADFLMGEERKKLRVQ